MDNWIASRVEFFSFDLLGVLAMDCFLEAIKKYLENLHQTYKSLLHRFCSPTMVPCCPISNLYLVFCIDGLHFFLPNNKVTSLSLEEFNKPCLLSYSKWSKTIESGKIV
jgi:hypothetical protein